MQRSDFLMKLMSVVLLLAIIVYIGIYIYNRADNPLVTAMAVRYTAMDVGETEGYIVREETVLTGGGSTVTLMATEGEKVASGETLAVSYEGERALERASEIRALQLQLTAAQAGAEASAEARPKSAADSVLALSAAVQHKNLENLPSLTMAVQNLIFTGSAGTGSEDILTLQAQLSTLLAQDAGTRTIAAPLSGVFSAVVDGCEEVGPGALSGLAPSTLKVLFDSREPVGSNTLGKLITGITWYYAAVMSSDDAAKLVSGNTAEIQFTKTYNATLQMKVESVGDPEGGKTVVVFSSKSSMADITALRQLTGQVLFNAHAGLLVPKEAVYHEEDGTAYIYLLTALQAEKVDVTILCENGDSYVVQDGTENGTVLREGSEIIVKAKELFDGKVVER